MDFTLKIVFRVDSSLEIGIGHLMRCLTLASELSKKNIETHFICRELHGNSIHLLKNKSHQVHVLPKKTGVPLILDELQHSSWLTVTQEMDAEDCKLIVGKINPDWIIIDSYAINKKWHKLLRPHCKKIMVIDDLADRRHDCDILLDQTFGRESKDYKRLVPERCQLLLGSSYALLRADFKKHRTFSLARRENTRLKQILICMGSADPENCTTDILTKLSKENFDHDIIIKVVINSKSPHLERIKRKVLEMPYQTDVLVDLKNMAELMADSDIAIGASGSMTWERCCLGLPTIQLQVADNQKTIVKKLQEISSIIFIEKIEDLPASITKACKNLLKLSLISSVIVDGFGTDRVIKAILNRREDVILGLSPAKASDSQFLYDLQTKDARKYFINPDTPQWISHLSWLESLLSSSVNILFIIKCNEVLIGSLRLDLLDSTTVEVSIMVHPKYSGRGMAGKAIAQIKEICSGKEIKALVHKNNKASQKLFTNHGFKKINDQGIFDKYYYA